MGPASSPPITYYALDLERRELVRTLEELNASGVGEQIREKFRTRGLCATYDEGIHFIRGGGLRSCDILNGFSMQSTGNHATDQTYTVDLPRLPPGNGAESFKMPPSIPRSQQQPLHILFLGSSLGNFSRGDGAAFLRSLPLRVGAGDTILLGLDGNNDPTVVERAYNDERGVNRAFVMNSPRHARRILGGEQAFADGKWAYVGWYNQEERGCSRV